MDRYVCRGRVGLSQVAEAFIIPLDIGGLHMPLQVLPNLQLLEDLPEMHGIFDVMDTGLLNAFTQQSTQVLL